MDIILEFNKKLSSSNPFTLNVAQTLKSGDFLALYGKSGAGKTTILRILAGLITPDSGYIKVGNEIWQDGKFSLPPQKRSIGFMFQDYALFPHLSVYQNIIFSLKNKEHMDFVQWLIETMELTPILKRSIYEISGGQAQRVALARALARKPKILLLDEPLSALDSAMRANLQDAITKLHYHLNLTTILISHEVSEILKLSTKIWCIQNGIITKSGATQEVLINKSLSAKVQLSGEIVNKTPQGFVEIIDILCGSEILRIVYEATDAKDFNIGDKVLVASKAFNPLLFKIPLSQ